MLPKSGAQKLVCTPQAQPGAAHQRQLQHTIKEIIKFIPRDEPFILVDEEQIRGSLPHGRTIPFLQKDGQYWGPPPDDQTAIRELERLRKGGATRIVFISACFWWLKYYVGFHQYLRKQFRRTVNNRRVIVFDFRH